MTALDSIQIPRDIQEALGQPKWVAAINEEVQALEKNGTWELLLGVNGSSLSNTMQMAASTNTRHI